MLLLLLLLLLMLFRKIAPSAIYLVLRTRRSTLTRTCCARLLQVHRGNGARHFALPCIGKINAHHFSRFVEWGRSGGFAKQIGFDQFTPDVSDSNVAFLDAGRVCCRHCDANGGCPCEETAILAGKTDGFEILFFSFVYRLDDVGRIAACADADSDVAWPTQRFNLSSEYPLKAVVICYCGKNG